VRQGDVIEGSLSTSDRLQLFHAGTQRGPDGLCRTSGGRVLAVVAQAETFDDAFEQAYAGLESVTYAGITYRRDIGHQVRQR
jgi:phosphoribosylamine--glycine ligase